MNIDYLGDQLILIPFFDKIYFWTTLFFKIVSKFWPKMFKVVQLESINWLRLQHNYLQKAVLYRLCKAVLHKCGHTNAVLFNWGHTKAVLLSMKGNLNWHGDKSFSRVIDFLQLNCGVIITLPYSKVQQWVNQVIYLLFRSKKIWFSINLFNMIFGPP